MARDDRAEAVSTVEDVTAEADEFAPEHDQAPEQHESGNGESPAADSNGRGGGGNGGPPANGAASRGRFARKRTARQRTMLVAGAEEADAEGNGHRAPVDPLLTPDEPSGQHDADRGDLRVLAPPFPAPQDHSSAPATAPVAVPAYAPNTAPLPVLVTEPVAEPEPDPAPPAPPGAVPAPPRARRRARPRVRKVTRIVRSVDAWSVFKVALIFFLSMGVVLVTAGVLLWNLAQSTGTLDNVEGFFQEAFNYDTFELKSEPLFRALLTLTALVVVVGTGLSVVTAVLFNLIADLTGGIRVTVLEREVVARDDPRGRSRRRKKPRPAKATRPPQQAVAVDGEAAPIPVDAESSTHIPPDPG